MKIVLVHPAPKIWTRAALVPLGLAYIAANLEKNGFKDIEVIDFNVEPNAKIPKADVVGITATTPLIKSAWKIAQIAKEKGAITVIGGPHVSALPTESAKLSQVDFVCVGEGEETMLELCQLIKNKSKNFTKVAGLVYKKNRKIVVTKLRPFIENLDKLPFPAFHLFKLPLYTSTQPLVSTRKPALGILTSRGCPFGCRFCYKGTFGRTWRPRSIENVLAEWEYLVKVIGVKEIALLDDGFNIDIKRATKICREIKKRGLVVPWRAHNGIRADRSPVSLLSAMKKSGCYYTAFGVESGSQRILDLMAKHLKQKDVISAFKKCRKLGILTMAFLMIGNPGETREEIEKTISFALSLDPDFVQFSVTTPFPGTEIFSLIRMSGKIKVFDWDKYSQLDQRGYFDYGGITVGDVSRYAKFAYRKFYLRPRVFMRMFRRRETWSNLPNIFAGAAHFLLQKNP